MNDSFVDLNFSTILLKLFFEYIWNICWHDHNTLFHALSRCMRYRKRANNFFWRSLCIDMQSHLEISSSTTGYCFWIDLHPLKILNLLADIILYISVRKTVGLHSFFFLKEKRAKRSFRNRIYPVVLTFKRGCNELCLVSNNSLHSSLYKNVS